MPKKLISMYLRLLVITAIGLINIYGGCTKDKNQTGGTTPSPIPPTPPVAVNEVDFWLTKGDQSVLLQKQAGI